VEPKYVANAAAVTPRPEASESALNLSTPFQPSAAQRELSATITALSSEEKEEDGLEDGEIREDSQQATPTAHGDQDNPEPEADAIATRAYFTSSDMWNTQNPLSMRARSKFAPRQIIIGLDVQNAYDPNCDGAVPTKDSLLGSKLAPMNIMSVFKNDTGVPFKALCLRYTTFKKQGLVNLSETDQNHLFRLRMRDQSPDRGYSIQNPVYCETYQGKFGADSYVDGWGLVVVRLIEPVRHIGLMELKDWARLDQYHSLITEQSKQDIYSRDPGLNRMRCKIQGEIYLRLAPRWIGLGSRGAIVTCRSVGNTTLVHVPRLQEVFLLPRRKKETQIRQSSIHVIFKLLWN
jgi:hypothetical protein